MKVRALLFYLTLTLAMCHAADVTPLLFVTTSSVGVQRSRQLHSARFQCACLALPGSVIDLSHKQPPNTRLWPRLTSTLLDFCQASGKFWSNSFHFLLNQFICVLNKNIADAMVANNSPTNFRIFSGISKLWKINFKCKVVECFILSLNCELNCRVIY